MSGQLCSLVVAEKIALFTCAVGRGRGGGRKGGGIGRISACYTANGGRFGAGKEVLGSCKGSIIGRITG